VWVGWGGGGRAGHDRSPVVGLWWGFSGQYRPSRRASSGCPGKKGVQIVCRGGSKTVEKDIWPVVAGCCY
jgi:hypothetical protein